jgi:hypothetical protein
MTLSKTLSVNAPAVHVLHAQRNIAGLVLECSVECDDIGRVAVMAHLQLSNDLFADFFFGVDSDDLLCQTDY